MFTLCWVSAHHSSHRHSALFHPGCKTEISTSIWEWIPLLTNSLLWASPLLNRFLMLNWQPQLTEIMAGLNYLHGLTPPVVHGDLRGANILVTSNEPPRCCLADFGLALVAETQTLTSTSEMRGASRWLSPEHIDPSAFRDHDLNYDRRPRDIYAFACTVVEVILLSLHVCPWTNDNVKIITEKPPFSGQLLTDSAVIIQVLNGARPSRPESVWCSEELWDLVKKSWGQEPRDRPSAAFIHASLQSILLSRQHWFGRRGGSPCIAAQLGGFSVSALFGNSNMRGSSARVNCHVLSDKNYPSLPHHLYAIFDDIRWKDSHKDCSCPWRCLCWHVHSFGSVHYIYLPILIGSRAIRILSEGIPKGWRIVLVDRNTYALSPPCTYCSLITILC